ncbi:hypothetical protein PR048_010991 [Dryococelus australis]|uniref:Uncharacterized protein n=1 Tax=Dryococelus australis TaxID=614101 RepID=A0ABQ9HKJ3_9NEOP|nr:hypothetical protein PR048_010991 [Dryococelus australis]
MVLVDGFSRGYPVFAAFSFRRCFIITSITLIGSQDSLLRAAQISLLTVLSTMSSFVRVWVAQGGEIGGQSATAFNKGPSQHSPGVISGNHGELKSRWPDRESSPGPPECESIMGEAIFVSVMEEAIFVSVMGEAIFVSVMGEAIFVSVMGEAIFVSVMGEAIFVSLTYPFKQSYPILGNDYSFVRGMLPLGQRPATLFLVLSKRTLEMEETGRSASTSTSFERKNFRRETIQPATITMQSSPQPFCGWFHEDTPASSLSTFTPAHVAVSHDTHAAIIRVFLPLRPYRTPILARIPSQRRLMSRSDAMAESPVQSSPIDKASSLVCGFGGASFAVRHERPYIPNPYSYAPHICELCGIAINHLRKHLRSCTGEFRHWLGRSPPTTAIRARYLAVSLPDFGIWASCWMMPLDEGFSGGTPVSPALAI